MKERAGASGAAGESSSSSGILFLHSEGKGKGAYPFSSPTRPVHLTPASGFSAFSTLAAAVLRRTRRTSVRFPETSAFRTRARADRRSAPRRGVRPGGPPRADTPRPRAPGTTTRTRSARPRRNIPRGRTAGVPRPPGGGGGGAAAAGRRTPAAAALPPPGYASGAPGYASGGGAEYGGGAPGPYAYEGSYGGWASGPGGYPPGSPVGGGRSNPGPDPPLASRRSRRSPP